MKAVDERNAGKLHVAFDEGLLGNASDLLYYMVIDLDRNNFEFHRFKYNNEKIRELLRYMIKEKQILKSLLSYY